jgi:anti-anti-sigma factor
VGTPFNVEIVEDADPVTIHVKGELDLSTAGLLEAALERTSAVDVAVDLSGLSFIDSSGIRVLVLEHNRRRDAACRLTLRNCSDVCRRTFEVAGLANELHFDTDGSPDAFS